MIDVVTYLNTGLSTGATGTSKTSQQELGKDAFMQLLISQLAYQDPLEPMDNTEFISQLAQFSALEQQQNIAAGIQLLALSQTASTNSQMVNLIGKRVLTPGNQFTLEAEKALTLRFDLEGDGVPAKINIKNSDGDVVRTIDITEFKEGTNQVSFDGKDNDGNWLAAGAYTYEIVSATGDEIEGLTTYGNFLVDAVAFDGSTILLKALGISIDLGDISEVVTN
ncbi:MAG: flagellar basal-body rod modification protein FlgD [Acidobacteriota bacterium]|nr:flagellar basal-body rod modification protein FlgD [Acidobacteriota bacterium]